MGNGQKKRKMFKMFGQSAMAVILALALTLPSGMTARVKAAEETNSEENENVAEQSTADDILNADKYEPSGYAEYSQIEVYGNSDAPFLLSEQNELFLYNTRIDKDGKNREVRGVWFDNCDMTAQSVSDGYYFANSINRKNSGYNQVSLQDGGYSFVQGVGFNPLNDGRKDYAGYIGYKDGYLYCFVINPKTGKESSIKLNSMEWCKEKRNNDSMYIMSNYMSITAGDYDGDNHDTLLVFGSGDGNNQKIYEISFDGKELTSKVVFDVDKVAQNKLYSPTGEIKYKLQLTLTTGDFDGDGLDEFAFAIGNGNTSDSAKSGYKKHNGNIESVVSKVCVTDYDKDKKTWSEKASFSMYDKNGKATKIDKKNKTETYYVKVMQGASITSADIDGDGVDELIAAGYTSYDDIAEARFKVSQVAKNGELVNQYNCEWINAVGDLDKSNYVVSVISATMDANNNTVYERTELEKLSMEGFTKASIDKSKDSDYVFPHITMASGKTNGKNQPEDVFIDGSLYSFESGNAQKLYTPKLLTQHFDTVLDQGSSNKTSVYWINNVAVGNFDHNEAGREQFVYTVWFKQSGSDEYYAFLGIEGGSEYEDKKNADGSIKSFGTCSEYGGNNIRKDYHHGVWSDNTSACQLLWKDSGTKGANAVPVAVDLNSDGLLAKYNKAYYAYSDPEVIAVLEAPPQFTECQDEGSISYTISSGIGRSKSEGWDVSFNVGFAGEYSGGIIAAKAKLAVEAGVTNSFSKTFTNSYSISESLTVTASGSTSVIVNRVPVMIYVYDIYDESSKKWINGEYAVTVPLAPSYYSLSVDEYNELVEKYNKAISGTDAHPLVKLVRGKDIPSVENDPFTYEKEKISGKKSLGDTKKFAKLSTNKGSSTLSWEFESSKEEEYTHTHGFYVSVTLQGGWGSDSVAGFEAWSGVNAGLEANWSFTTVKSTTSGLAIEAEIPNLSKTDMMDAGYTSKQVDSYKMSWQLAKWERYLNGSSNDAVPVYGFIVKDVNALPAPVSDLDAEMCNDEESGKRFVKLTWSEADTGYRKADGYDVYLVENDGKKTTKTKIASVNENTYKYDNLGEESEFSFIVIAYKGNSRSFESNVAKASLMDKLIYDIKLSKKENGKNIYTVYYNDGTSEEKIEILDGAQGKSAYEIAVETGLTTAKSESEWIKSLKGEKGDKGDTTTIAGTGSKGDKGDKGDRGDTGAKGDKGDTGATGAKGDKGDTGAAGANGKSAYEIAVANGFVGTEAQWLASLKGADGVNGTNGTNGNDGTDGKSAYELAKEGGYAGTQEQWLASLKGADGTNGTNGTNGLSMTGAVINTDGHLIITMSDNSTMDAGVAKGSDGANGQNGSISVRPMGETFELGVSIDLGNGYVLNISEDGIALNSNGTQVFYVNLGGGVAVGGDN